MKLKENKKINYVLILGLLLGLLLSVLFYYSTLSSINFFDASELATSNKVEMIKIGEQGSREGLKVEITNKEMTQALLKEIEGNTFRRTTASRPSQDDYIIYFQVPRAEDYYTRIVNVSVYLYNDGKIFIYDNFTSKSYKGSVSKEVVKELVTGFNNLEK